MLNSKIIAVIKRELRDKLLSKTFIFMTVLIPVFMVGILALQTLFMSIDGDENTKLEIVSELDQARLKVDEDLAYRDFVKNQNYKISYKVMSAENFEDYLNEKKSSLLSGELTGIIFIPETALKDKSVQYYSKNPSNNSVFSKIRPSINKALVDIYFAEKSLSDTEIQFARDRVDIQEFRVSKDEGVKEEGVGNRILSFLFTFLLYLSLIILGTMVMRSVVEEKNNRIVEILLSSVDAKDLMTGKILGNAIIGLAQMTIWLSPVMLLISTSFFVLPPEFVVNLNPGQLLYFLLNYFIGLITFLGLFASVGAIFDNDQDAQSGIWPVMMLIMIPFFISFSMANNPDNSLATIASMFPFASIIVMPARLTLIDVPLWQLALSFIINLAVIFAIFPIAGKIYRIGILMTGKKPKWSEVIKWIRE